MFLFLDSQMAEQQLQKMDLKVASAVLPGLQAVFKATQPTMRRHSRFVEPELLEGAVLNLPRSLVRLAWIL